RAADRRLSRRRRRPALAAGVVARVACAVRLSPPAPSRRGPRAAAAAPSVVLIVVDTLRRDHLSAYGYARPTSAHIARLAAEGALFAHAYSTASWTLPAHASLFTVLYASTHRTATGP